MGFFRSDMTSPGRKKKSSIKERKVPYHRSLSSEVAADKNSSDEEEIEKSKSKRKTKLVKSKSEDNHSIVNRLRMLSDVNKIERSHTINCPETSPTVQSKTEDILDWRKSTEEECPRKRDARKLQRSKRITGEIEFTKESIPEGEKESCDISLLDKNVVVETNTQFVDVTLSDCVPVSPVSVFVQTTRKLFTPFVSNNAASNAQGENEENKKRTAEGLLIQIY